MFKLLRAAFRHYRQIAVVGALLFASALCVALVGARVAYTRNFYYIYFVWNLFLAWLPMLCALTAYNLAKARSRLSWLMMAGCAFVWLLFFPNAPYLLTDILHLAPRPDIPLWYDLILVIAFAMSGTLLGLVSLYLMQLLVHRAAGPLLGWLFALGVLALSGFGIWLGRFQRWNSWDLFTNPVALLSDIAYTLRHPLANWRTFAFSALFSLVFLSAYLTFAALAYGQWDRPAARLPEPDGPFLP
ncbi:MAG: DUF1361 domain-containing protein [Anaerolineales bacterium]|nr:DUF1361 domain-containing protein [Anaerolineales bacterium]